MFDKKKAPFYILCILREHSDFEHQLKQQDIIDKLSTIYNVDMERKTISSTIELLIELGNDIQRGDNGYYLNERQFDETEVKFLIDAIYSSKYITGTQAKDISERLCESLSKYQKRDYSYINKSGDIDRGMNNQFFLNIDTIKSAIDKNKKITFSYLSCDGNGNIVKRMNDYKYTVSPYYLINNYGKYYLLCNVDKYQTSSCYRVDLMTDIEIKDEMRKPEDNIDGMGPNFKINNFINDHIYMFGGKVINAKIRIDNKNARIYVVDWFGKNATLYKDQNDISYANIKSDENALFYWALQYQEHITVLEPVNLKNRIQATLKKTLGKYS